MCSLGHKLGVLASTDFGHSVDPGDLNAPPGTVVGDFDVEVPRDTQLIGKSVGDRKTAPSPIHRFGAQAVEGMAI